MDDTGFVQKWIIVHFLLYAPQIRPLLLLLDVHATHYSPETINLAAKSQVILFVLPSNTTHITQALDRGCFSPLKSEWRKVCHDFFVNNAEKKAVSIYDFCGLFSQAWKTHLPLGIFILVLKSLESIRLIDPL